MTQIGDRLSALGISLPRAPAPVASYVPVRLESGLAVVSGQIPIVDGSLMHTGSVPEDVSVEEAAACARQCGINALAAANEALGSLDRVAGVVRVGVFVACGAGFTAHPTVANGASELFQEVFGEPGRHARAAVGCSSLPLAVPVEVEVTFAVRG
ncbi:MAG: RidA family protein [Planctomycetota bacterium]